MRYIPKKEIPKCFKEHSFLPENNWNIFKNPCKKKVKKTILEKEQNWLCAYCEIKVSLDESHIEHIKPKSDYKELKFDYHNFIVSCNGKECRMDEEYDGDIHSCGHKKDNGFNEDKFLDPTLLEDIGEYFFYDRYSGAIKASEKDKEKADYMINLLNLDNISLNKKRLNVIKAIRENLINKKISKQQLINKINSTNPPAFVSFVRYYYAI